MMCVYSVVACWTRGHLLARLFVTFLASNHSSFFFVMLVQHILLVQSAGNDGRDSNEHNQPAASSQLHGLGTLNMQASAYNSLVVGNADSGGPVHEDLRKHAWGSSCCFCF